MQNKYVALNQQVLELVLRSLIDRFEYCLMADESTDEAAELKAEIHEVKEALKIC
jgi:hypothetical protein